MSNILDLDQSQRFDVLSGLIRVQSVCKCYEQTTLVDKDRMTIFHIIRSKATLDNSNNADTN